MRYLDEKAGKVHFAMTNRKLRCVSSQEISTLCKAFGFSPANIRQVLLRKGMLAPLFFKGIYYVKNTSETLTKTLPSDPLFLSSLACNKKLDNDWYFGLHTALKLNGLAGVQTPVKTFIITKKQIIPGTRVMQGMEFVFSRIKSVPFDIGIIERDDLRYSDQIRTVLDFLHLGIKKKNTKYAEVVLETVLEKNKKEFLLKSPKYMEHFSTKDRMEEIIKKHLGGYGAL